VTHLSLFSGIGGIDIAAHWAGFETIAFVEREPFCQLVLAKNFPGVPIHDDVTTFDAESFRGRVTLLSGGFPCQDISIAGKNAGLSGERSGLWFAMLDVISRVKPRFVLAENVAALYSRGIDTVLSGLEEAGYTAEPFVVAASDMGAPHRRQRVFIVAERRELAELDNANSGTDSALGHGETNGIPSEYRAQVPCRNAGGTVTELENALRQRSSSLHRPRSEDRAWAEDGRAIDAGASGDPQTVDPGELGDSRISGCDRVSRRRSGTVTQDGHLQPEASHRVPDAEGEQGGRIQQSGICTDIAAGDTGSLESVVGGKFDGLSRGMDGCFRFPARPGEEQHEWEAPRTITSKLPDRAKRLKALGNAVVPAQVYPILVAIANRIHRTSLAHTCAMCENTK